MEKRVISTDVMEEDYKIENSLRPALRLYRADEGEGKSENIY